MFVKAWFANLKAVQALILFEEHGAAALIEHCH
jgi:hypothetical protein